MKATDLMIGDWVLYIGDEEPCIKKVTEITSLKQVELTDKNNWIIVGENYAQPIELTDDILKKNGFLVDSNGIFYLKENLLVGIKKDNDYGYWFTNRADNYKEYICSCDFVHELQHILKLQQIEKEIEL